MAQKILGIKLEVDTSGLSKLVLETEKAGKALEKSIPVTERLNRLEIERANTLTKIAAEHLRVQTSVERANKAIEEGARGSNLAAGNMQRLVDISNKKLQEQLNIVQKLSSAHAGLKFASGLTTTAPAVAAIPSESVNRQEALLKTRAAREEKQLAEIEAYKENSFRRIAAFQEAITASSQHIIQNQQLQRIKIVEAAEAQAARNAQPFATRIAQRSFIPKQNSEVDVAGGMSKATLQQEFEGRNRVASAIAGQSEQLRNYNNILRSSEIAHKSLLRHVGEILLSYRALNLLLNTTKQAFTNIVPAGFEQQATQAALTGIFGTQQTAENLKFVAEVANKAGQSLSILEQSYRRFAPSAVLAGASLGQTNQAFKDFAEVSSILHLSADKVNSVFLALDQMFAKGVVQSEEIKKQLGNVLPAAVEIGAQAIGKTPAQFMDAMKKNEVIAKDFVPKFSALYRKIFGGADDSIFATVSERLFANTQRIKNQYEIFNRGVYAELQGTLNALAKSTVASLTLINENLGGIIQALGAVSVVMLVRVASLTLASLLGAGANRVYAASFTELSLSQGRYAAAASISAGQAVASSGVAVANAATTGATLFRLSSAFNAIGVALTSPLAVITGTVTAITGMTLALSGARVEYSKLVGASGESINNLMATYAAQGKGADEAGIKLQELARLQDKSNSLLITYQGTQIQFGSIVQAVWNNIKRSMQAVLDFIRPAFPATFNFILDVIKNSVSTVTTSIISLIGGVVGALKGLAASASSILNDIEHRDYTGILDRASTAFTDGQTKGITKVGELYDSLGSKVIAVGNTIANQASAPIKGIGESILADAKAIQELENKKKALESPTVQGTPPAVGLDDNSLESLNGKGRKDIYKNLMRDSKLATDAMQADLKQLDFAYHENLISINTYFEKKKTLQIQDIEQQLAAADKAKGIAEDGHDVAKVEQYTDQIHDLMRKTQDIQTDIDNEKYKALEQYNQKLQEVQADALEASGSLNAANVIRVNIKYRQDELLLQKNGTLEQQKQLALSKQFELSKGILATYDAKAVAQLAALNAEEVSINIARENGLLSQLQANERLNEVKLKILDIDKESVKQIEAQLALLPGNIDLVNKLNAAKAKVQQDYAGGASAGIMSRDAPGFLTTYNQDQANITSDKALTGAASDDNIAQAKQDMATSSNEEALSLAIERHQEAINQKIAMDSEYEDRTRVATMGLYGGMAGVASKTFEGITSNMIKMYGAQSKQAKIAFMAYKAFKIAEIGMDTAKGVMSALATSGNIYIGIALAAMVAAMGAVQVAQVIATPMPQAHAGLTSVPENNQTYVLSKGERVLAPQQNQDLTRFLEEKNTSTNQQQPQNIRIINAVDPELFSDWATSSSGERVIMNVVRRNQNA